MGFVEFIIPGRIGGKGRPRGVMRPGGRRFLTPDKTLSQEAMVRWYANLAMQGRPLFTGPVSLAVNVQHTYPKSWSEKRKKTTKWVTGRPDLDNVLKLIADALNKIVWDDDAQVASVVMTRQYTAGSAESVHVCVKSLEEQNEPSGAF